MASSDSDGNDVGTSPSEGEEEEDSSDMAEEADEVDGALMMGEKLHV